MSAQHIPTVDEFAYEFADQIAETAAVNGKAYRLAYACKDSDGHIDGDSITWISAKARRAAARSGAQVVRVAIVEI